MAAGEEFMSCSHLVYADLSARWIEFWLTDGSAAYLGVQHILCSGSPCRVVCHYMHRGMPGSLIFSDKSSACCTISKGKKSVFCFWIVCLAMVFFSFLNFSMSNFKINFSPDGSLFATSRSGVVEFPRVDRQCSLEKVQLSIRLLSTVSDKCSPVVYRLPATV